MAPMPPETLVERIVAFIEGIGIPVLAGSVPDDAPILGATVRDGALVVDRERLLHPGDLLHEAGHIAVTDPALRPTLTQVSQDGGEEMAAIAWSYAAAIAAGIDPAAVFHEHGYKGDAQMLLDLYRGGGNVGVPLLDWFGMTADPARPGERAMPHYPAMARWLR